MGIFDLLKTAFGNKVADQRSVARRQTSAPSVSGQSLSKSDKERIMVDRVSIDDMKQLTSSPFLWNCGIRKYKATNAHPFAYMDITGPNLEVAKRQLAKINALIFEAQKRNRSILKSAFIPINDIVFTPQRDRGYTRIICTPHTFTGKNAKYPFSLSFMTDLSSDTNTTHGDLFYGQDGKIQKATVYCWRNSKNCFLHFDTVDGVLTLTKVER